MRRSARLIASVLLGVLIVAVILAERHAARRTVPRRTATTGGERLDVTPSPAADVDAIPGDGTAICPTEFPVKGNASSGIYHLPDQRFYGVTIANICFRTAEAAEAAGYRLSKR